MPNNYQILNESGEVINTIVASEEFVEKHYPNLYALVPEPEPLTWADASEEYFHIEVGSFYDRFNEAKIAVLSSESATVQALVRDTQVRKFIDIKRPDVVQFVHLLCDKVPEVTEGIAADVLKLETSDFERVVKGLPQPEADS